jgi:TPP-dependent pyruvate/acetoin dehydrogenase alpha subunit
MKKRTINIKRADGRNRADLNMELYRKMFLIRIAEEKICEHYGEDDMKTPVHLSIGEEAAVTGTVTALGSGDQYFGTYRCHGLYLARTMETDGYFAELYGKKTGILKGKAGSMHLSFPEKGFFGTSAIVGGIIPVALGAAFANKVKKNGCISAVFFGEGAMDEGVFWETLNAACSIKVPLLLVCEDNDYAIFTHKSLRQGYKDIRRIVSGFKCNLFSYEGTDVEKVYNTALKAVHTTRINSAPSFLYLRYYRYMEHVGISEDYDAGYRSRSEFEKWYAIDPVMLQRKKLARLGFKPAEISKTEMQIKNQVTESIRLAKESPEPDADELMKDVYA